MGETLITEEDETLQEAEKEMRRLLDIIAEDQETILSKDKTMLALQNTIQEKEEIITKECSGISKQEMESLFKKTIDEQTLEHERRIDELKEYAQEKDADFERLKCELVEHKNIVKQ